MSSTCEYLDLKKLIHFCNEHKLPMEFNGKNLMRGRTDLSKLDMLLSEADQIYVNSDAHCLYELETARKFAFDYMKDKGYAQ